MSEQLPRYIEPFRLAEKGRYLQGVLPLAGMQRLAVSLESDQGEAAFALHFGIDDLGTPNIRGHLHADLQMSCQRCLGPMTVIVDTDIQIGLVRSQEEVDELTGDYEPFVHDTDDPVLLADIIEDELILGLPIVAVHDETSPCTAQKLLQTQGEKRENPFAVLAGLKKHS
ncbi:MAG: hypothetical protein A2V90_09710 [Gammaproteobacteria bacterium RBG_16_57_12]|nr:MAG: hypothetical protein A2V90_09710 [Gammaproteobacteria bacterium RBG_16_57_12]